jgi:uncharacterized protein (DUF433 family)
VAETRIPTRIVWALAHQGLETSSIVELYPRLTRQNIREAVDLEDQLEHNLHRVA